MSSLGGYQVLYDEGEDEWIVKREGARRASAREPTKRDAERKANALASQRNETVILFRKDGTVQNEFKPR